MGLSRLGEADNAVEPVVVGNGQCPKPQPGRFGHECFGGGDTVKKTKAAVHVQFGVIDELFVGVVLMLWGLIGRSVVRPRGRITGSCPHGRGTARPGGIGELFFQL
ncbi:MAG: Uncharacterised protein [Cellulomonadaceae bacterium TMED98]|nr:MAG: Uncharacterised protein [Cellulomonadaceae bacterium TMED98]